MIQKTKFLFKVIGDIQEINKKLSAEIESAGKEDNLFYVKLKNGKCFFSNEVKGYQKKLYFLFSKEIKQKVPIECLNVLFDINYRYLSPTDSIKALEDDKFVDLKEGQTVFEIGCYIGLQAIRMSELVGDKGLIVAVEAIPKNFEILKKNIEKNEITNIKIFNLAIWKEKGTIDFTLDEKQKNSAIETIVNNKKKMTLPCNTLDNIFDELQLKKLDFCRIQVNGAEVEVMEGMTKLLKSTPTVMVTAPYTNIVVIQKKLETIGYNTQVYGQSVLAKKDI